MLSWGKLLLKPMLKVLVVDDHHLILSGTIDILRKQYPELEIFIAKTVEDALYEIEKVEKKFIL